MTFQTNAGATFAVSAAAPSTYDQTGYEALSWTAATAAEILDYQGPNPEWTTATDNSYSTSDKAEEKASRMLGEASIMLRYLKSNSAFWSIIDTAETNKTDVLSVRFQHSNGTDSRYYTVMIKKAGEIQGGPDDFLRREIVMLPQTTVVKVDA